MFARQIVPLFRLFGNGNRKVQRRSFMLCQPLRPHLWHQMIPGEARVFTVLALLVPQITDVDMPRQQGILYQLLQLGFPLHHLSEIDAVSQRTVGLPNRNAIIDTKRHHRAAPPIAVQWPLNIVHAADPWQRHRRQAAGTAKPLPIKGRIVSNRIISLRNHRPKRCCHRTGQIRRSHRQRRLDPIYELSLIRQRRQQKRNLTDD